MVKILIEGEAHLSIPNLPRYSRHTLICPKRALPFGTLKKVWSPFGSLTAWQAKIRNYKLIHSFNKIVYTDIPWIATFEDDYSILYRNPKNDFEARVYEIINRRLSLDNCRKLIAISDYAKLRLTKRLQGSLEKAINKVEVIHPNFPVKVMQPKKYDNQKNIQIIFIGNHFARKGGIVVLRLANKAHKMGLPITFHIVSRLKYGQGVPTDYPDSKRYEEDLKLLDLPNVIFHKTIPNTEVLALLSQSHFQLMPTLHDTYGYSIIEGFSVATPAITTNVCALPEFVHPGQNGYLLELELSKIRHWKSWLYHAEELRSEEYWISLNNAYNWLAEQALEILVEFIQRPDKQEHYQQLSAGALAQALNVHDSQKRNESFDELYSELTKS